jgi:hypothetical protein
MTAPDEAVVTFSGNGYSSPDRVREMALLRSAEVTLQHGCRYFVVTNSADVSRVIEDVVRPGVELAIKMSNDEITLQPIGLPKDAAFLTESLRQHLGIKE